jgi:hypothetical protein
MNLGKSLSHALKAVLASLFALALAFSLAAPAHAASIILTTNTDGTPYGEAGGQITFPDGYSFKIVDGWVKDYCDGGGDDRGIYLYGRVALRGADSWSMVKLGLLGKDSNGCGQNAVFLDSPLKFSYNRQVRYVELWICEEDRDVSTQCLHKAMKSYNNPLFY